MPVLKNRAKMSTSTTGTGTITLGSAESGYQTFADAGVSNGNVVRYVIEDGNNFEIGTGTYTASGTTLTRSVSESNNSNNAINLSGSATVFISAIDDDIVGGPRGVDFDDNVKARFGNSNDLEIYHSGSASIIEDTGNGPLHIKGSTSIDFFASNGEYMAYMVENGAVGLYHNGSQKLNTTSTGASVTGKLTVDNSTEVDDALISIKTSTGTVGAIRFYCESGNAHYTELKSAPHSAYSGNLSFQLPASDGSSGQFLKTDGSGNLSFAAASGGADLYAANPSSATDPTASGSNSVAIGSDAQATATNGSIAFGTQTRATGNANAAIGFQANAGGVGASAIGYTANAAATFSAALGYNAKTATGSGSVALGTSYASGSDAFAAAIANNTSSYGATGANSIALGDRSKSTGSRGISIGGYGALASGTSSLAFGYQATANQSYASGFGYASKAYGAYSFAGTESHASGSKSVALGLGDTSTSYGALHDNGVALGYQATTSAAKQIALGSSTAQVKVSGAYTLPTADGSANYVLTTNGSGVASWAAAGGGGGADLYAANDVNATAPSATGDNSVAIGPSSEANSADATAFGYRSEAKASKAVAIGEGRAGGASATAISIGTTSTAYGATGVRSIAMGYQAKATGTYSTALGQNSVATGEDSFAIGKSLASGADAFAAAIDNNTSSYGATGSAAISMGVQSRATASDTAAVGTSAYASGTKALALGYGSTASGTISIAIGDSTAEAYLATSFGQYALSNSQGKYSYASGRFGSTEGSAQQGTYVLRADTTDATPEGLTTRNNGGVQSDNQVNLPNNSAYFFSGTCIAREQAADGTDVGAWEFKGAIRREANAGTTTLIKSTIDEFNVPTGWALALSADTTNGALAITITGAASTNIRWVATVQTSEVIYA